jgi:hypothetical protein
LIADKPVLSHHAFNDLKCEWKLFSPLFSLFNNLLHQRSLFQPQVQQKISKAAHIRQRTGRHSFNQLQNQTKLKWH